MLHARCLGPGDGEPWCAPSVPHAPSGSPLGIQEPRCPAPTVHSDQHPHGKAPGVRGMHLMSVHLANTYGAPTVCPACCVMICPPGVYGCVLAKTQTSRMSGTRGLGPGWAPRSEWARVQSCSVSRLGWGGVSADATLASGHGGGPRGQGRFLATSLPHLLLSDFSILAVLVVRYGVSWGLI